MQKHLLLSVLLAFGLIAMSAPAITLVRRNCIKRAPTLSKSSTGGTSHAAPAAKPQAHKIGRRAREDISLCGISLRSHAASLCVGNPGFVDVKEDKKLTTKWKEWDQFSLTDNECDHLVELQLVKVALESVKFCEAWEGMIKLAASKGHVQISAADQAALFAPLKDAANDNRGLHYLAKEINGAKKIFVTEVVQKHNVVHMSLPINSAVVSYISALAPTGDIVAAGIDHAAVTVLNSLLTKAMSSHKEGTTDDEKDAYACDLMTIMETAVGHEERITAVSTYWRYLRNSS